MYEHSMRATNVSSIITGKGKRAVSYIRLDGQITPLWVIDNGGYNKIINEIINYINSGYDIHQIRVIFNTSPNTLKNFINNNLNQNYIDKEKINRCKNSSERKSAASKGRSSPLKGKTYTEIYKDRKPTCGFKKGDLNPNFTREKYIGCKLLNKSGKKFRSSYEVIFSNFLEQNNIKYDYEHHFKMINGRVKIVDFIIDDKLVEVTGYAYLKWQQDFDIKIALLHESYPDKNIVIICDEDKHHILKEKHGGYCTILSLNNTRDLLREFQ